MPNLIDKYNDAANYNLGRKGNLTQVISIAIPLAIAKGKLPELTNYLNSLPPTEALNNQSLGLEQLLASLNNQAPTVEISMAGPTRIR